MIIVHRKVRHLQQISINASKFSQLVSTHGQYMSIYCISVCYKQPIVQNYLSNQNMKKLRLKLIKITEPLYWLDSILLNFVLIDS